MAEQRLQYFAFCKRQQAGLWKSYSDTVLKQVGAQHQCARRKRVGLGIKFCESEVSQAACM